MNIYRITVINLISKKKKIFNVESYNIDDCVQIAGKYIYNAYEEIVKIVKV